ncbi:coiled-coil domain-containing protein [Campylobacter lari]|uniref:Sugar transferase n=1 Tax=Campylobacter lari TaxID=201 RepID=A0A825SJU7_CAMLA|nr:hypothetical protein [Campylobacter lari]EAK0451494.1 sugar transferase [Campylobacter lari]MCW0226709.1 hypothetical protein [Campylobacter lari]MCW0242495.1 hypothetical protein [Campylobacter lari]MCW0254458.1 hypothetical protein [Campylobacter lari]
MSGNKFFLANRTDGLGSRLVGILNAFYLAKKSNNDSAVRFSWITPKDFSLKYNKCFGNGSDNGAYQNDFRGTDVKIIGMSIEEKEKVFNSEFISKYYISSEELNCKEKNGGKYSTQHPCSIEKFMENFMFSDKDYYEVGLTLLHSKHIFSNVIFEEYREVCTKIWENIDFSPLLRKIMKMAVLKASEIGDFVCIHVRSGDAIYDYANIRKFHKTSFTHATNAALALELIEREVRQGNKVVVIGDDVETNRHLIKLVDSNNVYCSDDLRDTDSLNNLELFMYDLTFMRCSKKLYGTYSALVKIVLLTADVDYLSTYCILKDSEYYEILKKNYKRLSHISSCQKAFILFHLFWCGREMNEGCEILCSYLDKALELDFDNDKYRIYKVFCLLENKKIELAEMYLREILLHREEQFVSLLMYKNFAGSFQEVFNGYYKYASENFPYISYIAFKLKVYENDYLSAVKFLKYATTDKKRLTEDYKLILQVYDQLNDKIKLKEDEKKEVIKNKDDLIASQSQQIQSLNVEKKIFQAQINNLQSELKSLPIKKIELEISILEQDLFNKKLKNKQLTKAMDMEFDLITPEIILINSNSARFRVRNHLSYKLGQALIVNSKSILGYIRMPFVLSFIRDQHKTEQCRIKKALKENPKLSIPTLESCLDYKEALRETQCFTYKLGEIFIKASKNWYKGGYLKFYFKDLKELKKEFEK